MPEHSAPPNSDSWVDRIELGISVVLQAGIFIVTVSAMLQGNWLVAFNGALIFALSFAPALIKRKIRTPLPVEFTLITCLFLFAAFTLGEVRDFYEKIWWWDLALHGLSGLTVGIIGFLSIYVFYMTRRIEIGAGWIAVISFAIAVTVGTLWEIFEFLTDHFFGFNMQKSGLVDSMTDLLINTVGATIAAVIGYFYVSDEDSLLGRRLIRALAHNKNKNRAMTKT